MDYIAIEVPDMNDSVSRVVLSGTAYQIRFSYNHTGDYWKMSLRTALGVSIVEGIKIVPNFPLNVFFGTLDLPNGFFLAHTKLDRIGRNAFKDGQAKFYYVPL